MNANVFAALKASNCSNYAQLLICERWASLINRQSCTFSNSFVPDKSNNQVENLLELQGLPSKHGGEIKGL